MEEKELKEEGLTLEDLFFNGEFITLEELESALQFHIVVRKS